MPTHHGPTLATRDGLTVIDCRDCGWAHLDPLPAIPDGYYEQEFWDTKGAGWLERYEAERDWLDMRNGDWLSVVEEHTAGRTLLDVGCGYGFFMQAAYERGWKDFGIEPSAEAKKYTWGKRGPIWEGTWGTEPYNVPFDCISALWLMEHLPNPFEFLAWCRAHLATGGALLLCVPNDFSANQYMANGKVARPYWWVHPTHLNYWTWATFANLLGRAGFRIVDRQTNYPMEYYLNTGHDYTVDDAVGDWCHAQIREDDLSRTREERVQHYRECSRLFIGRDQIIICK